VAQLETLPKCLNDVEKTITLAMEETSSATTLKEDVCSLAARYNTLLVTLGASMGRRRIYAIELKMEAELLERLHADRLSAIDDKEIQAISAKIERTFSRLKSNEDRALAENQASSVTGEALAEETLNLLAKINKELNRLGVPEISLKWWQWVCIGLGIIVIPATALVALTFLPALGGVGTLAIAGVVIPTKVGVSAGIGGAVVLSVFMGLAHNAYSIDQKKARRDPIVVYLEKVQFALNELLCHIAKSNVLLSEERKNISQMMHNINNTIDRSRDDEFNPFLILKAIDFLEKQYTNMAEHFNSRPHLKFPEPLKAPRFEPAEILLDDTMDKFGPQAVAQKLTKLKL